MSKVLVRKAEGVQSFAPMVQTNVGGGGSPFFIQPREPVSPQQAGMDAAMSSLRGMRGMSPEQQQTVADSATRGAQRATNLVQGKYGMPSLAMLGLAGLKNTYNASIQGQAPSITGTFGDAYGMAQYAQPFAATFGAERGAQRGIKDARQQAADAKAAERTGSPASADFNVPEGFQLGVMGKPMPGGNQVLPGQRGIQRNTFSTANQPVEPSPLEQTGLGNVDPNMMSGDARAYGMSGVPSMSMQQFRQMIPSFSPPPRQTTLNEFTPPPTASPTPPAPEGMAGKLESALPDPMQVARDQLKEQQDKRKEEEKEMKEEQREKLAEDMKEQQSLGTGA